MANLMVELAKIKEEIEGYARGYGLTFFNTVFEVLEFEELNQVAAYGGFPTRYPHWSFGMEYDQLSKGYEYGLSKIYEMVINNDPCYAYLLKSNPIVDQKLVMAHVYGHGDFFKNNYWFSQTDRKMIDTTANHATRVRRYIDELGHDRVEEFLDTCLSLDNLVDPNSQFVKKRTYESINPEGQKLKSNDYMDAFINPPEHVAQQQRKIEEERRKNERNPASPMRDVLLFLIENAPLENWERDILTIIRKETLYFMPQAQTKIMNEGWASYWHSKMMTRNILSASEIIDYADHHSGTLASAQGQLNPYKIGIELFRDIEDRWNKGKFGKEYDECSDLREKKSWDQQKGLGIEKIFEVRKVYNDVMFIDEFLTEEFCLKHKLFTFEYNPKTTQYEIFSRAFQTVKKKLLHSLTNRGQPFIFVQDSNFENRSELLLLHKHEGIDLKLDWANATLENLFKLWKRPVNLLTVVDEKGKILTFDGKEHKSRFTENTK
ncbi:MAG: SpoVR family protein [Proteobacteria bacterium]|jgi:stage V sporulation protein R|nr:SpoVR family protein [Pseudomonadota bacterium]